MMRTQRLINVCALAFALFGAEPTKGQRALSATDCSVTTAGITRAALSTSGGAKRFPAAFLDELLRHHGRFQRQDFGVGQL